MATALKREVPQDLYIEALKQVTDYLVRATPGMTAQRVRPDAERYLVSSLHKTFEFHEKYPPLLMSEGRLLSHPRIPERTKTILRESRENTNRQVVYNHRSMLIAFLTTSDEMSRELAGKLADAIIDQKQ